LYSYSRIHYTLPTHIGLETPYNLPINTPDHPIPAYSANLSQSEMLAKCRPMTEKYTTKEKQNSERMMHAAIP
jgi:hypothetical protein